MPSRTAASPSASQPLALIVLAAGLGKRMQSDFPKVLARTGEASLIEHVLRSALPLKPSLTSIVVGHKGELVESEVSRVSKENNWDLDHVHFAHQPEQRGTGDAVKCALPILEGFRGNIMILCGDMPLVRESSLRSLLQLHEGSNATLTLMSLRTKDPAHYGRVLRDSKSKRVLGIVEARDCRPEQLAIDEINAAIYIVDSAFLAPAIKELKNENAQKEYYLTDIVSHAAREGQAVEALVMTDEQEIQGVNTRYELAMVNNTLREKRNKELLEAGVEILDPSSVYVDSQATIARGARIGPNVQILGKSSIAAGAIIEGTAYVMNSKIGEGAHLKLGVRIEDSVVGPKASVGPFAHLRPGTELGEEVKIGNFVETKKAKLSKGAKASHLTYLGDCTVGEEANIGAGTITCNYDGYEKFETTIGRDVFIGSNSSLVAPLKIEDGATIGAGSVITKGVEKDSLAFTRAPQVSKAGWSKRKRDLKGSKGR